MLFGRSGLHERIATLARELSPGEQQVVPVGRDKGGPQETVRPPDDVGRARSWTWLSIAGVGLIGLAALGVGLALLKRR